MTDMQGARIEPQLPGRTPKQGGSVARRAARAKVGPEWVFAVAHAIVARWWEQVLCWKDE
ncbi:hypothetical protein [Streptomyces phaeochromogenes]